MKTAAVMKKLTAAVLVSFSRIVNPHVFHGGDSDFGADEYCHLGRLKAWAISRICSCVIPSGSYPMHFALI